jgi:hypothetical protein
MGGKAKRKGRQRRAGPREGSRTYELPEPTVEALREQQRLFREKFGRDPVPEDPVFFDPDADEPRPLPAREIESGMVKAMHAAGLDPAFVYAFKVTGRVVTEQNLRNLTKEEILEWEEAVEEYRRGATKT